uniref:HNH endonuclease n=1 Tax=Ignisphaera aggregans TaxID=334771 RepID=A0A7J2U2Q3_9CREN
MNVDAYSSICTVFKRLCPKLVPKPLWRVSVAKLVRMNIGELIGLGLEIEVIEKLKSFWSSLSRDRCVICDSKASDIDEFWDYYVDGNRGIARLVSLRSLCSSCHLAKHIGYANVTGRLDEALEQLAKVNNLTPLDVDILLNEVYSIWRMLNSITTWRIEIAKGVLPEDIRADVENALNRLLEKRGRGKGKTLLDYKSR